jgi:DNA-binding beta-propeller fold protein YncE
VISANDGTLTWIDAQARRVAGRVRVAGDPIAVAVTSDAAWVTDGARGTVARVDLRTGAVAPAIAVGARPIAVAADGAEVYVLCAGDRKVWHVEPDGDVIWTRAAGMDPTGLALDARSVWVADAGGDAVIRLER